jgi:hypothetical protein
VNNRPSLYPVIRLALLLLAPLGVSSDLFAQIATVQYGESVPASVKVIHERALKFLVSDQSENGSWPGGDGYGSGVVGICVMAMMASGEDPDYGPYAEPIRRSLRYIISNQSPVTGVASGPGHGPMYHHGFATLALSEAYGVVNEDLLWKGSEVPADERRSIAQALELAVRCTLTAQQKNPYKAWRYSPESQDADTTVSGTVLMGLLGARNAGVEIPNEAIEGALNYFRASTMRSGSVSYQLSQGSGESLTRSAIATLVYAIGKRKQTQEYLAVAGYIKSNLDQDVVRHPEYHRYYMAQALFQSDFEAWKVWNRRIIDQLQESQADDGSFASDHGPAFGTGMAVLTLALNYRLLPVYER